MIVGVTVPKINRIKPSWLRLFAKLSLPLLVMESKVARGRHNSSENKLQDFYVCDQVQDGHGSCSVRHEKDLEQLGLCNSQKNSPLISAVEAVFVSGRCNSSENKARHFKILLLLQDG